MNETSELARFATDLKFSDLPGDVIRKTEELILDQFGVQVSSSTRPWCQAVYREIKELNSRGSSTIMNYGDRVGAELAAFANGTFGHGFEIDDTYARSNLHPGCVIVAASVALGERDQIDGKQLLLAAVTGYEVMGRIGRAMQPSMMHRGHHPTGTLGPIGAAASAGKILGFNHGQMVNALSVATALGGGVMEFTKGGGNMKRIYGGIGAQGGVRAATLVQNGITGPATGLEGEEGFCRAFSDNCRLPDIVADFGKDWVVSTVGYKRYHTDYMIQSLLDGIFKLRKENGLKPEDIQEIIAGTNKVGVGLIGTVVEPKDITAAQFSAPFCIGMALVLGSCQFSDFTEANLDNKAILEIAHKVKVVLDEEVQAAYPAKRAGTIRVKTRDGRTLEAKVMDLKGSVTNPMTREEVENKFRSLASIVLPGTQINKVVKLMQGLDKLKNVAELPRLLVKG
ncbi:MAG: MmgE/PrpD family protein [Dehalococcoidales bacterium]|nr:MmgE/PrpD family protein [Dehalococcoidales bacterium]